MGTTDFLTGYVVPFGVKELTLCCCGEKLVAAFLRAAIAASSALDAGTIAEVSRHSPASRLAATEQA
jgi:hypothetical protein